MKRRFVNLVTRSYAGWPNTDEIYSLHRIDPYTQFFYGSARAALEAADDAAKKNEFFPATQTLELPSPVMNFVDRLDMCGLLRRDRMVYASRTSEAGLYDADRHTHSTLPGLNAPKRFISKPICMSVPHPDADGEDSMYVLDRYPSNSKEACFEVLKPVRGMWGSDSPWRWRLLPPPPFTVREPAYDEPSSFFAHHVSVASFATVVDGNARSTIYISFDGGIGTYSFDTASSDFFGHRPAGSEGWSHVGEWRLPFLHKAQYVPEFNLWFGFLDYRPYHLCAVDISSAAMGREPGRPPAVKQVWQDLPYPPEGEDWILEQPPELVDLGDGKFLIAKFFEAVATDKHFALLTGVEMMRAGVVGGDRSIQLVMHKCARSADAIEWVL